MSFDEYDSGPEMIRAGRIQECKPDYEAQAAGIKKALDSIDELEVALFRFKKEVGIGSFVKISSIAEFIGGLAIKKSEYSDRYGEILKKIEKDS